MCPRYTDEDLTALAADDLTKFQTWRLRKHLTHCRECQINWAAFQNVWAKAQAHHTSTPPSSLYNVLAEALPFPYVKPARKISWKPLAAFGTVAAAISAIIFLVPGSPTHPVVAFADVERTIQQARIVTCTEKERDFDYAQPADNFYAQKTSNYWLRRSPPAYAEVPVMEQSLPPGYNQAKTLWDSRGRLIYSYSDIYIPYRVDTNKGSVLTPRVIDEIFDAILNPSSQGMRLPTSYHVTSMRSKAGQLNGKPVTEFVRTYWYGNKPENTQCTETDYADSQTSRLIRIERREYMAETKRLRETTTMTDFRYDVLPPPGTFDWSPPKGAPVDTQ